MGNKFVWKNLLINGILGAVGATLFCLLTQLHDALGFAWIIGFVLGDLIGIVIYVLKVIQEVKKNPLPKMSEAEYRKKKSEEKILNEYSFFFNSLSEDHITRLGNIMHRVVLCLQTQKIQAPPDLAPFLMAIIRQKETGHFSRPGSQKNAQISNELDMLEFNFNALFVISQDLTAQAANKGLGFGVIGSAADIALYDILDKMERIKNVNAAQQAITNRVGHIIQDFCRDVRIILFN